MVREDSVSDQQKAKLSLGALRTDLNDIVPSESLGDKVPLIESSWTSLGRRLLWIDLLRLAVVVQWQIWPGRASSQVASLNVHHSVVDGTLLAINGFARLALVQGVESFIFDRRALADHDGVLLSRKTRASLP